MSDSIFTKIIRGEIPCHKIYEDDKTFVFLDINPVLPGHTLVIPKEPVEFVWDLPDETYQHVMATSKKVALRLRQVMGSKYVSARIVGVHVPHAHVQLIPFNDAKDLARQETAAVDTDLAALAKKLAF